MLQIESPGDEELERLLHRQAELPYSYEHVGATRARPPEGWRLDHNRIQIGRGLSVYRRARQALADWSMFGTGWTSLRPAGAPIAEGTVVAVVARTLGLASINVCRIVYTVDEEPSAGTARYGFAYGTLPHHVARGEERFLVEHRRDDDSVWFDVLAFSRPAHWLVRLGYPYMRICQRRFARDAKAAMRSAVS